MNHKGENVGDGYLRVVTPLLGVDVSIEGKWSGIRSLPESLKGRQLHRVEVVEALSVKMTAAHNAKQTNHSEDSGELEDGAEGGTGFFIVKDLPSTDGNHQKAARRETCKEGVGVLTENVRISHECEKVRHHGTPALNSITCRVLHKRVCDENPKSREVRAESHEPNTNAVLLLAELIPAKNPNTQESGFQEEGRQSLKSKRCTENITHKS